MKFAIPVLVLTAVWWGTACPGFDTQGECFPQTRADLASLHSACSTVSVNSTGLEDLNALEAFEPVNGYVLFCSNNDSLTDVSGVGALAIARQFKANASLRTISVEDVAGLVHVTNSPAVSLIEVAFGGEEIGPQNEIYVTQSSSLERIALHCSDDSCAVKEISLANLRQNDEAWQIEIESPENIAIGSLFLRGLPGLDSLEGFANLQVNDSVELVALPGISTEDMNAFHTRLRENGLQGEFRVCDRMAPSSDGQWGDWEGKIGWGEALDCRLLE